MPNFKVKIGLSLTLCNFLLNIDCFWIGLKSHMIKWGVVSQIQILFNHNCLKPKIETRLRLPTLVLRSTPFLFLSIYLAQYKGFGGYNQWSFTE